MTDKEASRVGSGWEVVERERRLDRMVRRICVAAWALTFVLVLIYAGIVVWRVSDAFRMAAVGAIIPSEALATLTPLVVVLGILALLVATLSTVGVFLRFRTAALSEIQLRLASLEAMLAAGGDR